LGKPTTRGKTHPLKDLHREGGSGAKGIFKGATLIKKKKPRRRALVWEHGELYQGG